MPAFFVLIIFVAQVLGNIFPRDADTPTCLTLNASYIPDVVYALYLDYSNNTCADSLGVIQPDSIWYGFSYGDCHPYELCGSDCTCLESCGSQGLSIEDFNYCYEKQCGGCISINTYITLVPDNNGQLIANFYNSSSCIYPVPGNYTSDYFKLGTCNGINPECNFGSVEWTTLPDCQKPDVNAGNMLSSLFIL